MRLSVVALVAALALGCSDPVGSSNYTEIEVTARYVLPRESIWFYEFTPASSPHVTCIVTAGNAKGISCFPKDPK